MLKQPGNTWLFKKGLTFKIQLDIPPWKYFCPKLGMTQIVTENPCFKMLLPTEISAGKLYSKHKIIQSNLDFFYVGSHSQNWPISSLLLPQGGVWEGVVLIQGVSLPPHLEKLQSQVACPDCVPWLAENTKKLSKVEWLTLKNNKKLLMRGNKIYFHFRGNGIIFIAIIFIIDWNVLGDF